MTYKQIQYEENTHKILLYFIIEIIFSATLLLIGTYLSNNIIMGLGVSMLIIAIILFVAFNKKEEKKNEE